jgi:hypothetical protein
MAASHTKAASFSYRNCVERLAETTQSIPTSKGAYLVCELQGSQFLPDT